MTSRSIDELAGARVFAKCENLQRVGAFKLRGAANAVFALDDRSAERGVVTHSSGNFAQALALAAKLRGIPAFVVMPEGSTATKIDAVRDFGAEITLCPPTLRDRESTAATVQSRTGATFLHPYDDTFVIAGQGTAAKELIEEVSGLDAIIAPLGGGGLLAGTALAARALAPNALVFGAEPENADDGARSLRSGRIEAPTGSFTIADGLRTGLGHLTFAILSASVSSIATVSEQAIVDAMKLFWSRTKLVIEPSSAVAVAAILSREIPGSRIGVILSGGNVDLEALPFAKPVG
ncbi:MAG: pyridoxal-phosphate dependent enzyme [Deltaproteobacteria bacterium]|nr:pyridoxal-phosphate dependent enzyme [Deltaproteobacteria bacterium]